MIATDLYLPKKFLPETKLKWHLFKFSHVYTSIKLTFCNKSTPIPIMNKNHKTADMRTIENVYKTIGMRIVNTMHRR